MLGLMHGLMLGWRLGSSCVASQLFRVPSRRSRSLDRLAEPAACVAAGAKMHGGTQHKAWPQGLAFLKLQPSLSAAQ